MNLYKVSRTDTIGYDEYVSVIVAAPHRDAARKIHPSGRPALELDEHDHNSWVPTSQYHALECTLVGTAAQDVSEGVILARFRNG